ncbi:MAG TPA: DUF4097 family beta strand repeat-containing protein [Gemmatimonadaceae bacterium]|nr:DUF4097 family beta strand repeat-containing protein [Gemmatimonadaceae bacterium]
MRRLAFHALALLVVASPISLAAQEQRAVDADAFRWQQAMQPGTTLILRSANGAIDVTAAQGSEAAVQGERSGDRDGRDRIVFDAVRDGDNWVICARYESDSCDATGIRSGGGNHSHRGNVRADLTVRLPRGVKLHAGSGNGAVTVRDAGADVVARTGNGRVSVSSAAGAVEASSGNGAVTVDGAQGTVSAHTGNGDVQVTTVHGPVSASSGNGSIVASMAQLDADAEMHFSTGNGSVRVTLPADFQGEVDANTGNGSVRTDFPITMQGSIRPGHVHGTIGNGGTKIRMSSGNGSLSLIKAG